MKIKINLKALIFLLLGILIIAVFLYLYFSKYSIADIDADNYNKRLKPTEESIFDAGISRCIPDNYDVYASNYYSEGENEISKVTRKDEGGILYVVYESKVTQLAYQTNWKGSERNILYGCSIRPFAPINYYDKQYKRIIDKLILNESFTLKESKLKGGFEILIKETPRNFIIVRIAGSYSKNEIVGLYFETYSKSKYF